MAVAILVVLISVCAPVLAHSAEMGVAQDQYDLGIPVYWPHHAALMSTGLGFLVLGFLVMHFGNRPGKINLDKVVQTIGRGFLLAGLAVAVFMVTVSGAPHAGAHIHHACRSQRNSRDQHDGHGARVIGRWKYIPTIWPDLAREKKIIC